MKKKYHCLALKEYMAKGNPVTNLEALTMFGVNSLQAMVSDLRKSGWVIESRTITYVEALTRVNNFLVLTHPKDLAVRDILLREYWVTA